MRSGSRPLRRLVQNEQVRFGYGHRCEREPLALATRQIARMAILRPAQPDAFQRSASPLFIPVHGQGDLLERRLLDEVAARILGEVTGATSQFDAAGLRLEEAGGDAGERGLSRPVRPFERDDLAPPQLQVDPVQDRHGLVVGEGHPASAQDDLARRGLCFRNTMSGVRRTLRRQPLERFRTRGVEEEAALVDEEDPRRELECPADAMLREHDGRAEPFDGVEEERRAFGIELRGRLVEEQQLRLQRERGCEAHTLELAAGELDRLAPPQMERVHREKRSLDARPDLGRRHAEILEPERHLVRRDRHHDLVLRILEDGRNRAGELGWTCAAGVEPGDDDPAGEAATVEVRHEPRERAQQRRLPGARGAKERDDLPNLQLERDAVERRRRGRVREREAADGG